ncbi:MAG TPA: hypothetical protein VGI88_03005, partial [Verrucomicrobiae bacterium]
MDKALYFIARAVVAFLQALPLRTVARLGRAGGAVFYWLDGRHRRVALANLTMCFGHEKSAGEIRALAKENFRRIGENFTCAAKTASMTYEELKPFVEFNGPPSIVSPPPGRMPPNILVAIGHFGNFELYARFGQFCPAILGG